MLQAFMLCVAIILLGVIGLPAAILYYGIHHPPPPQFGPSMQEKLAADWGDRCVTNGNGEVGRTLSSGRDVSGTYVDFRPTERADERFRKYELYVHLKIANCPERLDTLQTASTAD
jgi:hypothetical protein